MSSELNLVAMTRDAARTLTRALERPIEQQFFTFRALDVATADLFIATHRRLETALHDCYERCRRELFRRWVLKVDRRQPNKRARVDAVVHLLVQRTYEKCLRHWQALAATFYVYRRFVAPMADADEYRLQMVPLGVSIGWARIMLDEFRPLLAARRLEPIDLLAPLTHGNLQLAAAVQSRALVHTESRLLPLRLWMPCPDVRSATYFVEQLYTLSRDMPRADDRRRITLPQLDLLNKMFLLRLTLRHGTPLAKNPLVRDLNVVGKQYGGALALRQSLVRLLAHVDKTIRRWRRDGPLPVTQTMQHVLRARVLMLIEGLDCALLLHRVQRLHVIDDLVGAAARSLAERNGNEAAERVIDDVEEAVDPFNRLEGAKTVLRERLRPATLSDVDVHAEVTADGVLKFRIEPKAPVQKFSS